MKNKQIPLRSQVKSEDMWDLTSLFKTAGDWESALKELPVYAEKLAALKGRIADNLLEALRLYEKMQQLSEATGLCLSFNIAG